MLVNWASRKYQVGPVNNLLMHEDLLVPETKSRDTDIPNSINAIIGQDTKTYIQSICLYSSMFIN